MKFDTVIFDLGGVLIDWNPKYLYRKIFNSEEEIDWFLENICTPEWNDQQDAGRSFAEATDELVAKHPKWEVPIRAWYERWEETIGGPVHGTVDILRQIKSNEKHRLLALTNWSAESFPVAKKKFEFLDWFEGIVVSGVEKTRKPYPEIYQTLLKRYSVNPGKAVFIDDNPKNVQGGIDAGIYTLHFKTPEQLKLDLNDLGITL